VAQLKKKARPDAAVREPQASFELRAE